MSDSTDPDLAGAENDQNAPNVRLSVCDLNKCEARCCYDGVYLEEGEEERIRKIVESDPEFFQNLPGEYIVDGSWRDRVKGRKTAVKPHLFESADFPAHFNQTRCVFCDQEHKCMFQVLAIRRGLHKWSYKPMACWMFPMRIQGGEPAPPPSMDEPDPYDLGDEYPGYMKFVPCGQDREDGDPWEQTLEDEIAFWEEIEASENHKPK